MTSNGLEALIIVALGANLPGELNRPRQNLEKALVEMRTEHIHPVERSHWWRSAAWPDPSQPDYINGVALVETTLSPRDVLAALHRIEARLGRVRLGANAARTLDLDLIAYGREVISEPDLELPHPRASNWPPRDERNRAYFRRARFPASAGCRHWASGSIVW